ncbi:PLP-dependent cysteine synthase family protein [Sphingomonas sp. GM_Shp_2]|uniref:PLP-dependent cysteine synthase family protein n=1 Tax=Sphingomonas sp. GM_Shp_2 TaxID=2937380 RepID=UPI00226AFBC8|nr:PLP-dependent cysteine synthase family protein [Sphingomonas sp. GM_Shp_2]
MATEAVRLWQDQAVRQIEADATRSSDTHLIRLDLPGEPAITLYLKDESSHPTGSLKHRLARSLFLYALCNGLIGPDTHVIEASSGSTAVSEAYFARLLGLKFIAVVPAGTARPKIDAIRFHGGDIHIVNDPREVCSTAHRLAAETGGHFMDQFTNAERATDWRGNNNIAESMFAQLAAEDHPVPRWIVCGAGTGGTSATIGRFLRYRQHATRLCVADPTDSVFHRHHADPEITEATAPRCSLIEGIGRPRIEPSFMPSVIDRMVAVDDAASIGAMRALSDRLGRRVGGSTGTNLWACATLIEEMVQAGEGGSLVTLLCDGGDRYAASYYDDEWLHVRKIAWQEPAMQITALLNG